MASCSNNHLSTEDTPDEPQIDISLIEEFKTDEERWLNEICSPNNDGRKAGTPGCDSVALYIDGHLKEMGYDVNHQVFVLKDSIVCDNIFVIVPGVSDSLIVIGAHYDGAVEGEIYPAADDNGSGVVTLLSLCKFYSEVGIIPRKTILAGFWAAEEVTLGAAFNGSKYFVSNYNEIERVQYYCNLDCFARKGQGTYFYYSGGLERAGNLMSGILKSKDLGDLEFSIKENENTGSDYMSFKAIGVPYFGWNDFDTSGHIHSPDDSIVNISFDKIHFIVEMTKELIDQL